MLLPVWLFGFVCSLVVSPVVVAGGVAGVRVPGVIWVASGGAARGRVALVCFSDFCALWAIAEHIECGPFVATICASCVVAVFVHLWRCASL